MGNGRWISKGVLQSIIPRRAAQTQIGGTLTRSNETNLARLVEFDEVTVQEISIATLLPLDSATAPVIFSRGICYLVFIFVTHSPYKFFIH